MKDLLDLIDFCIEHEQLRGPLNATSPQPLRQRDLAAMLAGHCGRALLRPRVPARLLRAAMGDMSQLLVDGQRVLPAKAVYAGFTFRYGDPNAAIERLLAADRAAQKSSRPAVTAAMKQLR